MQSTKIDNLPTRSIGNSAGSVSTLRDSSKPNPIKSMVEIFLEQGAKQERLELLMKDAILSNDRERVFELAKEFVCLN